MIEAKAWLDLALVLSGLVTAVYAFFRWSNKKLEATIREVTQQIQPGANGGFSLADVSRDIKAMAEAAERSTSRMHKRIDDLSNDVRDLQLWAADRPCLLDRHDRVSRAKARLKQTDECGDEDA